MSKVEDEKLKQFLLDPGTLHVQLRRLREVHMTGLARELDTGKFQPATRLLCRFLHTPVSVVPIVGRDWQYFKDQQGLKVCDTPREQLFCSNAIPRESTLYEVRNTLDNRLSREQPLVLSDPNIPCDAGGPIYSLNNYKLGTACVIDSKPRNLMDKEQEIRKICARAVEAMVHEKYEQAAATEMLNTTVEMVSTLCHEIRNLIGPAITMSDLMLKEGDSTVESFHDLVGLLRGNVVKSLQMLQTVGQTMKSARQHASWNMEDAVSHKKLAHGAMSVLSSRTWLEKYAVLHPRVVVHATEVLFFAAPAQLHQVVENLLRNAEKYGKADTPIDVRTWVTGEGADERVVFSVKNEGPCIPTASRAKLFTKFGNRLIDHPHGDSTGIGLYVCKSIIKDMHGGRIWLNEEFTEGCDFRFSLERARE